MFMNKIFHKIKFKLKHNNSWSSTLHPKKEIY